MIFFHNPVTDDNERAVAELPPDMRKARFIMEYAEFLEMAKNIVILTSFWFIIVLDIWGIGSLIVHFMKWVHSGIKKIRNKDVEKKEE